MKMAPSGNSRRTKSRKRGGRKVLSSQKFGGNRYTKQQQEDTDSNTTEQPQPSDNFEGVANDGPTLNSSATARKLNTSFSEARGENTDDVDVVSSHYILIDSDIMGQIVSCIGTCPQENCKGKINFFNSLKEKYGLSSKLQFNCDLCNWSRYFYTSKELSSNTRGRKPYDINVRTVAAFREVGKGHSAVETVCGYMNICPPMNISAYKKTEGELYENYKKAAQGNMKEATRDVRKNKLKENFSEDQVVDIDASFDGTWQKRGYSSLNGVVTVISQDSGKCIDYRIMSKKCSVCSSWQNKRGTPEYDRFIADHYGKCAINFDGSAGAMESTGVVSCFLESVEVHKVRITNFIGDGDTKSHSEVVAADPYPGTHVKKLECADPCPGTQWHNNIHSQAGLTCISSRKNKTYIPGPGK